MGDRLRLDRTSIMARRSTSRSKKKTGGFNLSAIPAYFWLAVLYTVIALGSWAVEVVRPTDARADMPATAEMIPAALGATPAAFETAPPPPSNQVINAFLDAEIFSVPMIAGDAIMVSWTVLFILFGFICSWIEGLRALKPRGKAYNDIGSVLVTIPLIILMVGFESFQTTAFLVIVVVGFGDIIMDRIVNQGVSYRDYYAL